MPQQTAPLKGLQAAATPDDLIQQRMGVNQAVAGATGQGQPQMATMRPPVTTPQPAISHELTTNVPTDFASLRSTYDPQGMIAALKASGYTGMRTADIPLPDEIDFDQLMQRANAIR